MIHTKHHVVFLSPGTLFSEQSSKPVSAWDTVEACKLLEEITERYSSKPYGFYFVTCTESDPIPDGSGGFLQVEPKQTSQSCMYHINGRFDSVATIEKRHDPSESILLSNVKGNDWKGVVTTANSWKHCAPYNDGDQFVDSSGNILPLPEELQC